MSARYQSRRRAAACRRPARRRGGARAAARDGGVGDPGRRRSLAGSTTPAPRTSTIPGDLGSYAVLSCHELTLSGNSAVTSEGLETGTSQSEQGHARSNEDVTLSGSVEVHGDAVAGPGHAVHVSGSHVLVTGEKRVADATYACVPVDLAPLRAALEASNDNGSLPLTDKGKAPLGGPAGRTLDLSGHDGSDPARRSLPVRRG